MAYVDAAFELAEQVTAGVMPEPDAIVAVGSSGTAAGLAAGLAIAGLKTRVLGIAIATPMWFVEWSTRRRWRARACRVKAATICARGLGQPRHRSAMDRRWIRRAERSGDARDRSREERRLVLDPTYTAKAFAAALDLVAAGRAAGIVFWNTLSSAPMAPLLAGAPDEATLAPAVMALLR